jgi:hypothetical protein
MIALGGACRSEPSASQLDADNPIRPSLTPPYAMDEPTTLSRAQLATVPSTPFWTSFLFHPGFGGSADDARHQAS